jgi:hypothetical protein
VFKSIFCSVKKIIQYPQKKWVNWRDYGDNGKPVKSNIVKIAKLTIIFLFASFSFYIAIIPFLRADLTDLGHIRDCAGALLNGKNPYTLNIDENNYPPGEFYIYALIILIFGDSIFVLRSSIVFFTLLNSVLVFLLTKELISQFEDYKKSRPNDAKRIALGKMTKANIVTISISPDWFDLLPYIAAIAYLCDPAVIYRTVMGNNDAFTVFFLLLAFYYFFTKRELYSAIFFSISFLLKLVPLFIFPLIAIRFIKRKEYRKGIKFFFIVVIIVLFAFLPFLIDNFDATFKGITSLFSRFSRDKPNAVYMLRLYDTIKIGSLVVSIWFIIQVILYSMLIIILSNGEQNINDLMIGSIVIIVALPIITNCVGLRYFAWSASIFYIIMLFRKKFKLLIQIYCLQVGIAFLQALVNEMVYRDGIITGYNLLALITLSIMFVTSYLQTYILIRELIKLKNNVF